MSLPDYYYININIAQQRRIKIEEEEREEDIIFLNFLLYYYYIIIFIPCNVRGGHDDRSTKWRNKTQVKPMKVNKKVQLCETSVKIHNNNIFL